MEVGHGGLFFGHWLGLGLGAEGKGDERWGVEVVVAVNIPSKLQM